MALLFFLLDMMLMVVVFRHEHHGIGFTAIFSIAAHLLASLITGTNQISDGCSITLPALFTAVGASIWAAHRNFHKP